MLECVQICEQAEEVTAAPNSTASQHNVAANTTETVDGDQWGPSQPSKYAHLMPQRQLLPVVIAAKLLKDVVKKEVDLYFNTTVSDGGAGHGEEVDIVQFWIDSTVSTAQNITLVRKFRAKADLQNNF